MFVTFTSTGASGAPGPGATGAIDVRLHRLRMLRTTGGLDGGVRAGLRADTATLRPAISAPMTANRAAASRWNRAGPDRALVDPMSNTKVVAH